MDLKLILPLVSKVVGRDVEPDVALFFKARAAVGTALSPEGQVFFMQNWRDMGKFMESPEGQAAIAAFMNSWAATLAPKQLTNPPNP